MQEHRPLHFSRVSSLFRFALFLAAAVLSVCDVLAAAPVYLQHVWFHRGEGVNLITTPSGRRLAVDDAGQYILDSSRIPANRNIRIRFDTIQKIGDTYHIGRDVGNHGYRWAVLDLEKPGSIIQSVEKPLFSTPGYHFDGDPVRGNPGLAFFPDKLDTYPEGGMALTCGQSQWDSRTFSLGVSAREGKALPATDKDEKTIPIYRKAGGSVRHEDFVDRVFLDPDGTGFWYLGGRNGKHAILHARPGVSANRGRTLNRSEIVDLESTGEFLFEAGIAGNGEVWLMLARKNAGIGGVDAQRTLFRITREGGMEQKTNVTLTRSIPYARLALRNGQVLIHDWRDLIALDRTTLKPLWSRSVTELVGTTELDYRIYRVVGEFDGARLVVGLATPYRKTGEPTRALLLDPQGEATASYTLKPGSIDDVVFTADDGVMLFSSEYTAKLGGDASVRGNETRSIQRADKVETAPPAAEPPAQPAPSFAFHTTAPEQRHKLWFEQPAKGYNAQSMLLGNGHLGAMITGGTETESVNLNVDSMWSGNAGRMGSYQGFGRFQFHLGHDLKKVTHYRRELDLRTGIHTVTYRYDGVLYKREAFCSYPRGLLAIRFTADTPGAYAGQLELSAMHKADITKDRTGLSFTGKLNNGRTFQAELRLQTVGGTIRPEDGKPGSRETKYRRYRAEMPYDSIKLEGCDSVTVYIAGDTNYVPDASKKYAGTDPAEKIAPRLRHIEAMNFDQMRDESAADVSALFDRCTLELATRNPAAEALPTDQRRAAYKRDPSDAGFETLVFDANRYMMIASSRPGSLPANLQGLWNFSNWPAWTSDYHTDINVQMNYWFVEPANLPECVEPLFDYIEGQIPHWREDARQEFGAKTRGWTVRYMNNIDGGGAYKNFPPGSAWLAWHYAEHFKFSQNERFLESRAYPVLKELSEHWQDLLIERPNGRLTTPRTMSPEHKPPQYGISQDVQIVHNLFTDYVASAARLGRDADFRNQVADMRGRLLPMRIGRWGQLQEWEPDRDSRYSTHRHIQHLFAAFPGNQICPDAAPELTRAALASLEARGHGRTGWSKAWRMSLFARMQKPDLLYRQLRSLPGGFHREFERFRWELSSNGGVFVDIVG